MGVSRSYWMTFSPVLTVIFSLKSNVYCGYVAYLNSNEPASTKFWTMEKRMKQDKKTPGVCIELSKRNMIFDLVRFLQDEVIVFDDLDEFSEELRENVKLLKERFG